MEEKDREKTAAKQSELKRISLKAKGIKKLQGKMSDIAFDRMVKKNTVARFFKKQE